MKFTDTDLENVLFSNGWSATSRATLHEQLVTEKAKRRKKEKDLRDGLPTSLNELATYYFSAVGKEPAEFDVSIADKRMTITHVRLTAGLSNLHSQYAVVSEGRVYFFNSLVEVRQYGGRR